MKMVALRVQMTVVILAEWKVALMAALKVMNLAVNWVETTAY